MQGIFRCQFSCPVLEQKLGDPNQVQIAKRQCDCYTLNSYQFKISIYIEVQYFLIVTYSGVTVIHPS